MARHPPKPVGQAPAAPRRRVRNRQPPPTSQPAVRTLRDLFRRLDETQIARDDDAAALMLEVRDTSDRGCVILLASQVQNILDRSLLIRLLIHDSAKAEPLFDAAGPLSTFYGNILLAFAVNLISSDLRDELDILRRVRNAFAHSPWVIDFHSDVVANELKKSKLLGNIDTGEMPGVQDLPKERNDFAAWCIHLMKEISNAAKSFLDHLIMMQTRVDRFTKTQTDGA